MAETTITISTAVISIPEVARDNVGTISANVKYAAEASWNKQTDESEPTTVGGGDGDSYTYTWYTYTYTELTYSWKFSPVGTASGKTGTASVISLTQGAKNLIGATVEVKGSETKTTHTRTDTRTYYPPYWDPEPQDAQGTPGEPGYVPAVEGVLHEGYWSDWSAGTPTSSDGTPTEIKATKTADSINVWTRPGAFTDFNFSANIIIQSSEGLTVTKVNNWIAHCNKFNHWWTQSDTDSAGTECQATSNGLITASWYNACRLACADSNTRPAAVTGGPNGTIISMSVLAALGAAISKS